VSSWWYVAKGKQKGPVGTDQLHYLLRAGTITARSLLWKSGMKDWQPAARFDELALLLRSLPGNAARTAEQAGAWRRMRRHLGSTVALIVGCLAVIGGFSRLTLAVDIPHVGTFAGDALMGGVMMILGSLAYRSAKKQKLGEVNSTLKRQFLEIALLVPIFFLMFVRLASHNIPYLVETDPAPDVVISIWAIVAYLGIGIMPLIRQKDGSRRS
jgi:hypothetical protein